MENCLALLRTSFLLLLLSFAVFPGESNPGNPNEPISYRYTHSNFGGVSSRQRTKFPPLSPSDPGGSILVTEKYALDVFPVLVRDYVNFVVVDLEPTMPPYTFESEITYYVYSHTGTLVKKFKTKALQATCGMEFMPKGEYLVVALLSDYTQILRSKFIVI